MPPASKKKLSSYRELLVWQKAMDLGADELGRMLMVLVQKLAGRAN